MNTKPLIHITLLFYSFAVFANDIEDATAAYLRGDYSTTFTLFMKLAEQGDATAQFNLALMYDSEQGAIHDYKQAFNWYKKAAEQGDVKAQVNLGEMYKNGQGVTQDYIEALKWFNISSANGKSISITHINYITKKMTQEQIAEAQKLAREWMEKHQQ